MADVMARAARAKSILETDEWKEAWQTYRKRIMDEFEKAKSDDVETIMQLKRLLTASLAAQKHLEALVTDGKVEEAALEHARREGRLRSISQVFPYGPR